MSYINKVDYLLTSAIIYNDDTLIYNYNNKSEWLCHIINTRMEICPVTEYITALWSNPIRSSDRNGLC